MTFPELVAAMQAREGMKVTLTIENPSLKRGRRQRVQGVVTPPLDHRTRLDPEDDGRLVFRLSPAAWYSLDPRVVTDAQEDGRRLRVEMGSVTWLIETFAEQRRAG